MAISPISKETLALSVEKTIIVDTEAFAKAQRELAEVINKIDALKQDIENMLDTLHSGFDTPAGNKFIEVCKEALNDPLDKQKKAIGNISEKLDNAAKAYAEVFGKYDEVVNSLNT